MIREMVILYNEPLPDSGPDDWDVLEEVAAVESALAGLGIRSRRSGIDGRFMSQVEELAASGVRTVFNLVEAIDNHSELNHFIPSVLQMHGIAYTGNPLEALFITTSKLLTARMLTLNGIRVPRSYAPSEWEKLTRGKKYILKPVWAEGSSGITASSVFTYEDTFPPLLSNAADHIWTIEEYIEGREFNISILGGAKNPEILPPAEIIFRDFPAGQPHIVDYHAKWTPGSFEYENTVRTFPDFSDQPGLKAGLLEATMRTWNALGLNGYARVDFRTDENDTIYVLEANANPCISPGSGFVAACEQAGYSFQEAISRIIHYMNKYDNHGIF